MDDVKALLFSLLVVYSLPSRAAEVEYISPERQQQLESQFNGAQFSTKDAQRMRAHEWSCDMYGMRTHLQVQRDLALYKWAAESTEWHNTGAQVVSDYKTVASALVGQKDRFEDQVKLTKDGLLVSRLMLNNPQKTVIAYSVCKTL